jgi:hypothetical protein
MDEAGDSLLTENEGGTRTRKVRPRNCSKNLHNLVSHI